jgi:hypothetical protein
MWTNFGWIFSAEAKQEMSCGGEGEINVGDSLCVCSHMASVCTFTLTKQYTVSYSHF